MSRWCIRVSSPCRVQQKERRDILTVRLGSRNRVKSLHTMKAFCPSTLSAFRWFFGVSISTARSCRKKKLALLFGLIHSEFGVSLLSEGQKQ